MDLRSGQRIVVKSPLDNRLISGVVLGAMTLNQAEVNALRRMTPFFSRVREGDQAFRFKPFDLFPHSQPWVCVMSHSDIYVWPR